MTVYFELTNDYASTLTDAFYELENELKNFECESVKTGLNDGQMEIYIRQTYKDGPDVAKVTLKNGVIIFDAFDGTVSYDLNGEFVYKYKTNPMVFAVYILTYLELREPTEYGSPDTMG